MTNHTGRLYALALALVVFFLAWAVLAAHPWAAPAADKRLKTLAAREIQLRRDSVLVHQLAAQRWAAYRSELQLRRARIAAANQLASRPVASPAPAIRVVNLPPLTITRTS
jgi:hypothetical protein